MIQCIPENVTFAKEDLTLALQHEHRANCMVFSLLSHYRGEQAPQIVFEIRGAGSEPLYRSHTYTASTADEPSWKQWRIPPLFHPQLECRILIHIPAGTELELTQYDAHYEDYTKHPDPAVKFDAHLGFWGVAPENTMPAFLLAAKCGFDSCIVNPRRTKDGVFVCIHDKTINRTGRDTQGNPPPEPMEVADMTYEELLKWDFGCYKDPIFRDVRIPKLEDFFRVCAEFNMKPFFSTGSGVTVEEWLQIRQMLQRHRLLDKLQVKCHYKDLAGLQRLFSVFGNEIFGYTLWGMQYEEDMIEKLRSIGMDLGKVRGVIELLETDEIRNFTPEIVENIHNAGLRASAISCWGRKSGPYLRRLIDMGVSEFTEDFHCSFELNW